MQAKRVLTSLLSIVLILSLLMQALPLSGSAKVPTEPICGNGFSFVIDYTLDFKGQIVDVKGTSGQPNLPSVAAFDPSIYTDTDETITQTIAEAICARDTTTQEFNYKTDRELKRDDILAFYHAAMDTLNSYDYYSLTRCSFGAAYYLVGGKDYYFTLTYTMEFYLTPEQELAVDAKIDDILNELNVFDKPVLEKLTTVYRYICDSITYNLEAEHCYTSYGALIDKECVCQGYALALMRLLWELDVDIDVVPGIGNGGNHMWNIVNIDGEHYLLDSTWDSGYNISCYFWFLKGSDTFPDHTPEEPYPETLSSDDHELTAGLSHAWIYNESSQIHYCTACYTNYDGTGHKVIADEALAPTCTEAGLTEGSHCDLCKLILQEQQVLPAMGHDYRKETTAAPTCTGEGITSYTCTACSHSYTEPISATGHTPVVDAATDPTCTKTGLTQGSHCSVCEAVILPQEIIPALGHTEIIDEAVAPTCTNSGVTEGSHCGTCGIVLQAQEVVGRLEHDYRYTSNGDGTHNGDCSRCDSMITEKHSFEGETCFCGAKILTVDEAIQIYHTLDLASDISISFVVQKSALTNYDSFYMEFVLPEYKGNELIGTSTLTVEPVDKGSYYYFTLTGITAVRMGDMVDATLHMTKGTQEYISMTDSYSVATYAYATLEKSTDAKMLSLCADLLRYGAEAQSYKKYRTDALVDAAMTDVHRSYLSSTESLTFATTDSYLGDLVSPTITWVGKTLDLGSKVGLKFVFNTTNYSGDVTNLSMQVSYAGSNGETKTVTLTGAEAYGSTGSYYSFTFYGLLASELRTIVDVAIYDGETQLSETIRYSAESYASKAATGDLAPLCKALFAYSDSAKAYFTK